MPLLKFIRSISGKSKSTNDENGQPPPYSPTAPEEPRASASRMHDPILEKLAEYDTIFIVDDSSSMSVDAPSGQTRWREACTALGDFAELAIQYDEDGIDIYFINRIAPGTGIKGIAQVQKLFNFSPSGRTDIGARLKALLPAGYMSRMEAASQERGPWPKRLNYVIITDGEATDRPVLRKHLQELAQRLVDLRAPQAQIGFQFVQVGDDERAARFLDELDGDSGDFKMATDIVDTVKFHPGQRFDALFLTKALMGGINRRFDHKA